VFGYGSLIWNPAMEIPSAPGADPWISSQLCLITRVARGRRRGPASCSASTARLVRGGGLRIPAPPVRATSWRCCGGAEMVDEAYRPCWCGPAAGRARAEHRVREQPRPSTHAAPHGATSRPRGWWRRRTASFALRRYLRTTVDHFARLGIVDPVLVRIAALVERYLAAGAVPLMFAFAKGLSHDRASVRFPRRRRPALQPAAACYRRAIAAALSGDVLRPHTGHGVLSLNEAPWPPSPAVVAALQRCAHEVWHYRIPSPGPAAGAGSAQRVPAQRIHLAAAATISSTCFDLLPRRG